MGTRTIDIGTSGTMQLCLGIGEHLLVIAPDGRGIMGNETVHVAGRTYHARHQVRAWCEANGVTIVEIPTPPFRRGAPFVTRAFMLLVRLGVEFVWRA